MESKETEMNLEFRTIPVTIPSEAGRRSIEDIAVFDSRVVSAASALNGFKLDISHQDRPMNVVEADTDIVRVENNTVRFRVECNLADKNFDDPYAGYVTVLIIAQLQ